MARIAARIRGMKDLHSSLRSEVVAKATPVAVIFLLVNLRWAKDRFGLSILAESTIHSVYGVHRAQFLAYLRFS